MVTTPPSPDPVPLPAGFSTIRTFPTNTGRSVQQATTTDGEIVLVKRAFTPHWAEELREQAQHFAVVGRLAQRHLYPEVLHYEPGILVLRFFEGGSLDDLSMTAPVTQVTRATQAALDTHAAVSMLTPPDWEPTDTWRAHAADYLVSHSASRIERLTTALEADPEWADGAAPGTDRSRREVLEEANAWVQRRGLLRRLAPPRLWVATHGDLGLNNVLVGDSPAQPIFIDTRGWWHRGLPWWDPTMDHATLVAFHTRIEPALARADEELRPYHCGTGRLQEPQVRDLIERSVSQAGLGDGDPHRLVRMEIEIAIRLLGAVGVQLLTAPRRPRERADAVLELYREHTDILRQKLDELT